MLPSDFRALMPQFSAVSDGDIQRWLDRSAPYFDVSRWDDLYSDGLAYWVAHKLAIEGTAAGLPVVPIIGNLATRKKVGNMEVGYSDALLKDIESEPFIATSFGREYLNLRRQVGLGAVAV